MSGGTGKVDFRVQQISPNCERLDQDGGQPALPSIATDIDALIASGARYSTIYADLLWQYSNTAARGAAANHYDTLDIEQLTKLPWPFTVPRQCATQLARRKRHSAKPHAVPQGRFCSRCLTPILMRMQEICYVSALPPQISWISIDRKHAEVYRISTINNLVNHH